MSNAIVSVPTPRNEPVLAYAPGSPERKALRAQLAKMSSEVIEVAPLVGGHRVATGRTADAVMPHDHRHVLAAWHKAGPADVGRAIDGALAAHREWSRMDWRDRAAIFLRAADLLAGPYRMVLNAATMLGQSKTVHQAEIDAACESIDFWRFNAYFGDQLLRQQPFNDATAWNRFEYRPLEGFVFAVSPFNFTSIGANLPTAPMLMGNTVVFKPATQTLLASHFLMELFAEAGLPPGVINMVSGSPSEISDRVLHHPELAGIHFTGSTDVFQHMW